MFFQEMLGKLFLVGVDDGEEDHQKKNGKIFDKLMTFSANQSDEIVIKNSQNLKVNLLNKGESGDYEKLRTNLNKNYSAGVITRSNMRAIVNNIFLNRAPFSRIGKPPCLSQLPRCCLTRKAATKKSAKYHANGIKRTLQELDVQNILKTIRMFKVFFTTQLTKQQQLLLQLQRDDVIDAGDDTANTDTELLDQYSLQRVIDKKNPMEVVYSLGYLNRILGRYSSQEKLTRLDKRLLRGFYVNDKQELNDNSDGTKEMANVDEWSFQRAQFLAQKKKGPFEYEPRRHLPEVNTESEQNFEELAPYPSKRIEMADLDSSEAKQNDPIYSESYGKESANVKEVSVTRQVENTQDEINTFPDSEGKDKRKRIVLIDDVQQKTVFGKTQTMKLFT